MYVYDFCIIIYVIIPQSASCVSIWLILLITAERTSCLVWPFKVHEIFSQKNTKLFVLSIITFFILLTTSAGFCLQYNNLNSNKYYKIYFNSVYQLFKILFGAWLPSLIGLCLNITFLVYLKKMTAKKQPHMNNNNNNNNDDANSTRNETQLTLMILTISITFLVLILPYSVFELMHKLLSRETFNYFISTKNARYVQRATLLLIDLNHSTNFFLYVLTAKRFRNELKRILFFCKNNKDKHFLIKYRSVININDYK